MPVAIVAKRPAAFVKSLRPAGSGQSKYKSKIILHFAFAPRDRKRLEAKAKKLGYKLVRAGNVNVNEDANVNEPIQVWFLRARAAAFGYLLRPPLSDDLVAALTPELVNDKTGVIEDQPQENTPFRMSQDGHGSYRFLAVRRLLNRARFSRSRKLS